MTTSNLAWKQEVGTLVFEKTFPPITRHALALYCGASGDTNPVHVDIDFAKTSGFDDVFAHGMLVMGYLGSALEEVFAARSISRFSTRFSAITQLGAAITCRGTIASVDHDFMTIELTAQDQDGDVKLKGQALIQIQSGRTGDE